MRTVIRFVLLSGVLLLLLSALIVTTETEATAPEPLPCRVESCYISMPAEKPPHSELQTAPKTRMVCGITPIRVQRFNSNSVSRAYRDANGRVISAVRYEKSVYQLFRCEAAAG